MEARSDDSQDPGSVRRLATAHALTVRLLTRATIPLVLVMALTWARVAIGTFGGRGTRILLYGAVIAAVAMFVYALPTILISRGRQRPRWTGLASLLGILPFAYGLYLGAVGGALGALRAETIMEAGLGVLFLLAGFAFLRDFSRLAVIGRGIEASITADRRYGTPGSGDLARG
jgi:hypothetical protein